MKKSLFRNSMQPLDGTAAEANQLKTAFQHNIVQGTGNNQYQAQVTHQRRGLAKPA